MAAIQGCMRRAFKLPGNYRISNGLLLFNKRTALQTVRGRHQLPIFKTHPGCRKLLQTFNTKQRFVYRLASTNVTTGETDFPKIISEVTNGPVKNVETGISKVSDTVEEMEELPPIPSPDSPIEVADYIAAGLKEPTFESLGLANLYKPSGIVQYVLEFLHVNMDLPWWGAISAVTFTTRLILLPVSAMLKRNAVHTRNNMPELQKLQREFTEARHSGNYYDAALAAQKLHTFMNEKNIGPGKMVPALIQVPVFLTIFFGLKGLKEVESLKTGGLLWFTDLTKADPYYILPLLSSVTSLAALQIGTESGSYSMPQQEFIMKVLKIGFPVIIFLATFKFPTCLVFYWTMSNFFTLVLQLLFLIRPVARFFKIPELIKHDPSTIAVSKKKGFREGFSETLTNMKMTKELAERERLNTVMFEKAGTAPIPRTFKTNPKGSVGEMSSNK